MTASRRTGRIPSRRDPRTLRMASYLGARTALPTPPDARDWTHPTHAPTWGMWSNDVAGDCTCASRAHILQAEASNAGHPAPAITDAEVLALYTAVTGYDPARPETDRGAQMIDVLRMLKKRGIAGRQIGAYVAVDPANRLEVEHAINICGSLYLGLSLPEAWQVNTMWDIAPPNAALAPWKAGSWGGHAVAVLAYDWAGLWLVTWGALKRITWEGLFAYGDEAWTTIDSLWLQDCGETPSGFNAVQLVQDLARIGSA